MNICFIGFGNMARAIASGLSTQHDWHIRVSAPNLTQDQVPEAFTAFSDNQKAIKDCDIVILAVKPQIVTTVLKELKPLITANMLVVSIAAGITLERLQNILPAKQPIVRVMPNTPIAVAKGATGLYANPYVSSLQKGQVSTLFESAGIVSWLSEENALNAITALSGSGPAYVYLFTEAIMNAGIRLHLDQKLTREFTLQTLKGALQLLEESSLTPHELRQQVTSKGGTTAAALAIFEYHQFSEIIYNAMNAACQRAAELNQ